MGIGSIAIGADSASVAWQAHACPMRLHETGD
jgi:hypothetical protein